MVEATVQVQLDLKYAYMDMMERVRRANGKSTRGGQIYGVKLQTLIEQSTTLIKHLSHVNSLNYKGQRPTPRLIELQLELKPYCSF